MMSEIQEKIKELAAQHLPEAIAIRRRILQNPELSFEEIETSQFIREELDKIGCDDYKKIGGTGKTKWEISVPCQKNTEPEAQ